MPFRFVQTSDLHLGSPMTASALRLPNVKVQQRQRELRHVLEETCKLVESERADALLVPGDLFDDEAITFDDLGFVIEQFGRLPRPVVIAPGNHDFVSPASFYESEILAARHGLSWPANVHIFRKQAWQTLDLGEAVITGIGFQTHVALDDHLLREVPPVSTGGPQVLLFHGSRLTSVPPGKLMTLPFSDGELAGAQRDYAAIGHYHNFTTIELYGRVLGAYSGCPAGRGIDECGQKVVLIGEIGDDRAVAVQPVQLDRRRLLRVAVNCRGCMSNESIQVAIEEHLAEAGCVADDIVFVELEGPVPPSLAVRMPDGFQRGRFFHCFVDSSRLTPEYNLEQYEQDGPVGDTAEARFVRRLLTQVRDAEATGDLARLELARQAIEYGLDALRGGNVRPRGID